MIFDHCVLVLRGESVGLLLVGCKRDVLSSFLDPFFPLRDFAKVDMYGAVIHVEAQPFYLRDLSRFNEDLLRFHSINLDMYGLAVYMKAFPAAAQPLVLCLAPVCRLYPDRLIEDAIERLQRAHKAKVYLVFFAGFARFASAEKILVVKMLAQISHVDILTYG